jgi:hypothetical protein
LTEAPVRHASPWPGPLRDNAVFQIVERAAQTRAFFSGDSFLYTSKEKSYPLLRRRSGSLGSTTEKKKELDSRLRGNDEQEKERFESYCAGASPQPILAQQLLP